MSLQLVAWGEDYYPSRVPFTFTEAEDPGAIGKLGPFRGRPKPFGSSTYQVPSTVRPGDEITVLYTTVYPLLPLIRAAGATDLIVRFGYFHDGQCNFEYSVEQMRMLTELDLVVTISTYAADDLDEAPAAPAAP